MDIVFGELLRRLRTERGLSQQQLADQLHIDRSSIARWETGARQPDISLISRLSDCLNADIAELLRATEQEPAPPRVIVVDDERIILGGEVALLQKALPGAEVLGFTKSADALAYARENRVSLAVLDIELVNASGLELCRELKALDPQMHAVFLTAYSNYALDAWATGAEGFLVKPLAREDVDSLLARLQFNRGGGVR
ncbi:MAG: response regulator [Ruminococcaceae bacterium]|nr:response regulator [Oscillospiraceae bacterium]